MKKTYSIGAEVADMVAYNGVSARKARREALVTGTVVKVTKDYVHILRYDDNKVWKHPR